MGNPWDVKLSPFLNTCVDGSQRIGGGQQFGGKPKVNEQQNISAVDKNLNDLRRFIPAFNGTGELRPQNDEEGSYFKGLYF